LSGLAFQLTGTDARAVGLGLRQCTAYLMLDPAGLPLGLGSNEGLGRTGCSRAEFPDNQFSCCFG
jgi:hypothetical protein